MKTTKKLVSLFLVMATIFALAAVPARAAYNTYSVQQALSDAASILRSDLGRADDDAAVRALSDQWHFENGTRPRNNGYYYSGIDEAFYYYNNTSSNQYNRSNNYGSYSGNNRQQSAFRAYDLVSNYYNSTHPVVVALLDVLAAEYGKSANLSYLYSAKDGNYYYFGASATRGNRNDGTQYYNNGYNGSNGSYSQGLVTINGTNYYNGWYNTRSKDDRISQATYSYDGFTWYQYYADNREFFRVYNSNRVIWATEQEKNNILRYGTTPRGSSYLVAGDVFYAYNQNLSTRYNAAVVNTYGYQYGTDGYWDNGRWISYSTGTGTVGTTRTTTTTNTSIFTRVNYYNGMFTGVEQYINTADAQVLAKILASYKRGDADIRQVAAMGWSFMDYAGSRSYASCVSAYPDYDPNIATIDNYGRDLYKLACDLLFRKEAERHGITDVGRTLAKGNTFLWIENGVVYFRDRDCGADHSHDFNFTNVKNPYPSV